MRSGVCVLNESFQYLCNRFEIPVVVLEPTPITQVEDQGCCEPPAVIGGVFGVSHHTVEQFGRFDLLNVFVSGAYLTDQLTSFYKIRC